MLICFVVIVSVLNRSSENAASKPNALPMELNALVFQHVSQQEDDEVQQEEGEIVVALFIGVVVHNANQQDRIATVLISILNRKYSVKI